MELLNLLIIAMVLFTSYDNKDKIEELEEKELNIQEGEKNSTQNKTVTTPERLFEAWEINLKKKGIFDYVTKKDCENFDKMMDLYDKGKYPMHTDSKSIIPFDFNNDNIKDYLVNYSLVNCVRGNGWDTDFIFMTSKDGNLSINESLTNKLKTKIKNYVSENYGSDSYVRVENNYIVTKSFKINRISDTVCYGDFKLMQGGASCCPKISGNFKYNINEDSFSVFDLKNNN